MSPRIGPSIAELNDAVNCSQGQNSNGVRWYRRACSFGRPWNAAENSQRQTCKLSHTLSESTARDGLRLVSGTPQAALRPSKFSQLTVPSDRTSGADPAPYPVTLLLGRITSSRLYRDDHIVYTSNGQAM